MPESKHREKSVKGPKPLPKRPFSPAEIIELQELTRLVNGRRWEAAHVRGNTSLVPDGQKVALQLESIVQVLEGAKNNWVSQKLSECGYSAGTRCDINFSTGEIVPHKVVEPEVKPKENGSGDK